MRTDNRVIRRRFVGIRGIPGISLLLLGILLLAACSRQRTVTRDELRSDMVSAASLAAEAETFVEDVRAGRSTRAFAHGHADYLAEEVGRMAGELDRATAAAWDAGRLDVCRSRIGQLHAELNLVRAAIAGDTALAAEKERLRKIRISIEETKAHL